MAASVAIGRELILSTFQLLKHRHSFEFNLHDQQLDVLSYVLSGINVLAMLPTGFGKTAMAYLAPLILNEVSSCTFRHK